MNVFDCLSISITFNRSSKRVIFLLFPMFVPPSSFSFWPFAKDESPSMMAARLLTKTILATDYDHFLFSLCLLHLFSSFFHSWSIVLAPWFWRSRRSSVKIFKKTRLWNFLWSCRTRLLNDFNPSLSESFLKTYLFNRISCREDLHISIESSKWSHYLLLQGASVDSTHLNPSLCWHFLWDFLLKGYFYIKIHNFWV